MGKADGKSPCPADDTVGDEGKRFETDFLTSTASFPWVHVRSLQHAEDRELIREPGPGPGPVMVGVLVLTTDMILHTQPASQFSSMYCVQ